MVPVCRRVASACARGIVLPIPSPAMFSSDVFIYQGVSEGNMRRRQQLCEGGLSSVAELLFTNRFF